MRERSMEDRWRTFWAHAGASGGPLLIYQDLAARSRDPHRAYHDLTHIEHCLREFETVRPVARDAVAVEFALWFHDVIYDPRAKDNEERSAELAMTVVRQAALPRSVELATGFLVRATAHTVAPDDPDARLVVDIDLAILGQPAEVFD